MAQMALLRRLPPALAFFFGLSSSSSSSESSKVCFVPALSELLAFVQWRAPPPLLKAPQGVACGLDLSSASLSESSPQLLPL